MHKPNLYFQLLLEHVLRDFVPDDTGHRDLQRAAREEDRQVHQMPQPPNNLVRLLCQIIPTGNYLQTKLDFLTDDNLVYSINYITAGVEVEENLTDNLKFPRIKFTQRKQMIFFPQLPKIGTSTFSTRFLQIFFQYLPSKIQ
jgi:hypothetical protein